MMDHGALTDAFLRHLVEVLVSGSTPGVAPLVGDGVAPADGGWQYGQPGDGVFRPYVVLVSTGARPSSLDLSRDFPNWSVGFSLRFFGGSRPQADRMATTGRNAAEGFTQTLFGADLWKVIATQWGELGAVVRVDSTSPPFWQVFDTLALVCSP